MQKGTGIFLIFLWSAMIFMAGCTGSTSPRENPVATPTPQIVYVTVLVTPTPAVSVETPTVYPDATEPPLNQELINDEEYLSYINDNKIFDDMTMLETARPGSYDISTGYNSEPKKEAIRLTGLLSKAPPPGSEKMKAYRAAMLNALSLMDGSTAGFPRYREAMQTVILAKNTVLSEMHLSGSSSLDATHLSGYGNAVQWYNTTKAGLKTFSMHHNGERNFAITLKDENDRYISLLVNEIGEFTGKKTESLAAGNYYLEITADDDWTVSIF